MQDLKAALRRPRVVFLFLLALGITVVFLWLIQDFLLALLVAAILTGLVHPFYRRLSTKLGGRKGVAAGVTVILCLLLVVLPSLLFMGIVVDQAIGISQSAAEWTTERSASLQQAIEADPNMERLLPYRDEALAKAGEFATRAGTWVAERLAGILRGTAGFLLTLTIMLYAMFFFLTDGRTILNAVLRRTPLSATDQAELLGIFSSVGRATLKGTLVIGIVQGGLAGLALGVAGIDGAVFWAAVMTVLSIIPGVGTAIVWVPAVIYLALNGQVGAAVGVTLWCALIVGAADNILRPILVGKDTEMPDLLVMLTTLGGLALFGVAGILIGPIIGALCMTVWKLWGGAMDEARDDATAAPELPADGGTMASG